MNISSLNEGLKDVFIKKFFSGVHANVSALSIKKDKQLSAHTTKTQALLVCISGHAIFENVNGIVEHLSNGDYVEIEPLVSHWVTAEQDSLLLLMN